MAEKIAAVATGHARTGIGILRLSGDGCIEAAGQRGSRRCSPPGSGRRGRANLHAVRF